MQWLKENESGGEVEINEEVRWDKMNDKYSPHFANSYPSVPSIKSNQ